MDDSFSRYLLSKQTVDERALNRPVYQKLVESLPADPLRVVEVGAGVGTMPARLLRWGLLHQADYVAVDAMAENVAFAAHWLPEWAAANGFTAEAPDGRHVRIHHVPRDVQVSLVADDVFSFIESAPAPADLLIAHAFLDLLPLPDSLPKLFSLLKPGGLAWLTINFDGATIFEPSLDPALDAEIERLYHRTMDERPSGGDSRTGRHLFRHLQSVGAALLAAGASDWVVHPLAGKYPADEAFFLHFILNFVEQSLTGHPELDPAALQAWLERRRRQVDHGELVYLAHQLDFLVRV
jgi:SAM-dependent methyltransferase